MLRARFYTGGMDTLWTPWRYAYVTDTATDPATDAGADGKPARSGVPPALAAWPGDDHCVFCNLLHSAAYAVDHGMSQQDADRAARIVLRGAECFIVLNAFPYASGHCMIVPCQHQPKLHALPASAAQEMMHLAQRVDLALHSLYQPDGINMGLNLGKAAGAGVAGHMHLHALPRWIGDTNFMTVIGETRVMPEQLDTTWQRLRHALAHPQS
jgi:ATP adenylyltransferase